jgi:Protein of unknown function (DUF3617)
MKQFGLNLWTVLGLSCAVVAAAVAAEPPAIKPGMWEIRMQHTADGKATVEPTTVKQCKEASELAKAQMAAAEYARKNCSKNETHQSGSQWVTDMVCKVGAGTMTSHTVTVFTGDTAYHIDTTSTFDPPAPGHSRTSTTVDGTWLGPCPPD